MKELETWVMIGFVILRIDADELLKQGVGHIQHGYCDANILRVFYDVDFNREFDYV